MNLNETIKNLERELAETRKRAGALERALSSLHGAQQSPAIVVTSNMTIPVAASKVLSAANEPMRPKDIAEALYEAGFSVDDLPRFKQSVAATLSRRSDEDGPFIKLRKGIYGLREWKKEGRFKSIK